MWIVFCHSISFYFFTHLQITLILWKLKRPKIAGKVILQFLNMSLLVSVLINMHKVVLHRSHGYFFRVKVKTVKLIGGRSLLAASSDLKAALYACVSHTDDGIHSDHGYLETWEIPGGPP